MTSGIKPLSCVLALFAIAFISPAAAVEYGQVAAKVANLLENEHYNDQPIDDEVSRKLLQNYLDFLDIGRLYFIQPDVDQFRARYETTLDDALLLQDISAGHAIYGVYQQRVIERVGKVEKLLATTEFTFDSDRTVQLSRKDLPWPANEAEADQVWFNIIESEVLQEVLRRETIAAKKEQDAAEGIEPDPEDADADADADKEPDDPREIVAKRYKRILESLKDNDTETVAGFYLKSLSHSFDPHSDYFTQSEYENFQIQMSKHLEGIGALLSMTDSGYAEIRGLVVGGPAHRAGELQVGDRLIAVGQDRDGQPTDIMHMKLQDVVDLIRGKTGSTVRLDLIPAGSDAGETKTIYIKREQVDLKESLARAELIETKDKEGRSLRLGWIDLPSFYADMQTGETSVSRDTKLLLLRLMSEGMQGLILDLRANGGGSLEEAINLTGLFIPKGPVVQAKDSRNQRTFKASREPNPVYNGPLVVLTSKSSASASEILAAALQDYNRAIIVGERSTFGKGTVQQLLPVTTNQFALLLPQANNQAGALKLTIQKFYRIAGGSTQRMGVIPDLILPSVTDAMDLGEAALNNPLPYDEIPKQTYSLAREKPLPIDDLRKLSLARIGQDHDFQWVLEETERYRERKDENTVTLNKEVREAEIAEQEARNKARIDELKERFAAIRESEKDLFTTYSITKDRVYDPELRLLSEVTDEELSGMRTGADTAEETEEQKALEAPHGYREVKREAISILMDFIENERVNNPGALTISQQPLKTAPAPN